MPSSGWPPSAQWGLGTALLLGCSGGTCTLWRNLWGSLGKSGQNINLLLKPGQFHLVSGFSVNSLHNSRINRKVDMTFARAQPCTLQQWNVCQESLQGRDTRALHMWNKKAWFLLVHIAVQTGSSELYGFPMLWTSLKNPKNYIHRFSLWPMKCSRLATWLRFKNLLKSLWKSNMVHRYALNILAFSEILSWKHFLFYFQNKLYMF